MGIDCSKCYDDAVRYLLTEKKTEARQSLALVFDALLERSTRDEARQYVLRALRSIQKPVRELAAEILLEYSRQTDNDAEAIICSIQNYRENIKDTKSAIIYLHRVIECQKALEETPIPLLEILRKLESEFMELSSTNQRDAEQVAASLQQFRTKIGDV